MTRVNGLPGFDAWLTHNPMEDDREPSASQYDAARAVLGAWASDEQVTKRAFELMDREDDDWNDAAEEAQADSKRDDRDEEGERYD